MKTVDKFEFEGIEYRIIPYFKEGFTLQYKAPIFPGSLRKEWKYCGDFELEIDAKQYAKKRSSLISCGDTVML